MHFVLYLATLQSCFAYTPSSPLMAASSQSNTPSDSSIDRRELLSAAVTAAGAGVLLPNVASAAAVGNSGTGTVPTTTLGTLSVSQTIQGYWQLAGGHGAYKEEDALSNMKNHFDAGVTALDTADIYGPSEVVVGKFVASQPRAVPMTKFCCFRKLEAIDRAEVRSRILKQCTRLQVDKLPLVAFFWADYSVKRYVEVALMLTELKKEGLIGEIGVTNFDLKRLKELVDAGVPVVSNQVQYSLLDQRPSRSGMVQYCADSLSTKQPIQLIAFGTVGAGLLSEKYLGRPEPPAGEELEEGGSSLRMYSASASRAGGWSYVQKLLTTLQPIAKAHSVSISNVAQRYLIEQPGVGCLLVGVRNSKHVADNVRTHSFALTGEERAAIAAVAAEAKGPKGDVWDLERGYV